MGNGKFLRALGVLAVHLYDHAPMFRTRIKICGMMRPQDAATAQAAGADAIGLIFHPPAKRNVSLDQARQMIAVLGPFVTPVGVFVDATAQRICHMADQLGLRIVQLHGHEEPRMVNELRQHGLRVIKAVRADENLARELAAWRDLHRRCDALAGIVLETADTGGGSGIVNDWELIRQNQQLGAMADLPPIIAAGGLTPENVAEIVRTIRPWAVDVSSGVEVSLGNKSVEMIETFVTEVRRADG